MSLLDTKKVAFGQLRTNQAFRALTAEIEKTLAQEREVYENSPASEFRRGRVCVLRELLEDMVGTSR